MMKLEQWSLPKGHQVLLAAAVPFLALAISEGATAAPYVEPDQCGGEGQAACYISAAKFERNIDPGGDAFWDPREGAEWWNCDGWTRTWSAVTAWDACVTGGVFGSKKRARFIYSERAMENSGAFKDIFKGEWWRCPAGFYRNANPVDGGEACSANIGQACDAGLIDVGNPIKGYSCQKKNVCGANGQRPCVIAERVPSCNSGLKEDFVDGICVSDELAQCLTLTRSFGLGRKALDKLNEAEKVKQELLEKGFNEVLKIAFPDFGDKYQQMKSGSEGAQFKDTLDNTFLGSRSEGESIALIEDASKFLEPLLPELKRVREAVVQNQDQIVNLLSDTATCSMTAAEREQRLFTLLGGGPKPVDFASLTQEIKKAWYEELLINEAFAQSASSSHLFLRIGLAAQVNYLVGAALEFYWIIDMDTGDNGLIFGVGPAISMASTGPAGGSVVVAAGLQLAPNLDDIPGWSGSIGLAGTGTSRQVPAFQLGLDFLTPAFNEWEDKGPMNGVVFTFGAARPDSIEASASYGHEWLVAKFPSKWSVPPKAPKPVAHWGFNENLNQNGSAIQVADDHGPNNLDATANEAATMDTNGELVLPADNRGHATIPDHDGIDFGTNQDFTVSVWTKPTFNQSFGVNGDSDIVEKWEGNGGYPYVIRYLNQRSGANHGKINVARYDGTNNPFITSNKKLDDGKWHHIALVKSGENLTLYIDGSVEGTVSDSTSADTTNTSPIYIGKRGSDGDGNNNYNGSVDDLRLYDTALSASQISDLASGARY